MKISHVNRMIRKGVGGTFRALKPGEPIEDSDIIVADTYYDYPSEQNVGQPCEAKDRIIRLEFTEKGPRHI